MTRSLQEFAAHIACVVATDAARCDGRAFSACTPPTQQEPARSLAAPAGSESGACTDQNRHQFRRFAWYTRSKRLILASLIAAMAPMATAVQSDQLSSSSQASTSLIGCIALDAASLLKLIVASSLLTTAMVLAALFLWHGLILPLVNRWVDRSIESRRGGA
ncbi:hypothetical protein [Ramlibacter sp. 2FC]|uniref:hypothetical protein n=1 Tax=Ramlibacter sp. 2FC TaxID=2502188 RepID=UPI0010FA097F|nr:hypothetical protein [Ramlibacter sp. 2FC]